MRAKEEKKNSTDFVGSSSLKSYFHVKPFQDRNSVERGATITSQREFSDVSIIDGTRFGKLAIVSSALNFLRISTSLPYRAAQKNTLRLDAANHAF